MNPEFNSLPWHDAELLEIYINRADAGNSDNVYLRIQWPNESTSTLEFTDCYRLDMHLNFGIIANETIHYAEHIKSNPTITTIKNIWKKLGISLNTLHCYHITTASTNSDIFIYACHLNILQANNKLSK